MNASFGLSVSPAALFLALLATGTLFVPVGSQGAQSPRITVDDWYWAPGNRWSWMNTRRVFPSANISRGPGRITVLPQASREISGIRFSDPISGKVLTVADMLGRTYTDGFIVLKDGKVVAEKYFNGMREDTPHLLMSVTKSVVGTLAGILVARGKIHTETLITDYLPELKGTIFDGATVRNALDMTVAARLDGDPYKAIDQAAGWIVPDAQSAPGLRAYLATLTHKNGAHGKKFLYLDPSPQVICWIIERVTRKDFSEVLQEEIWSKLGAEHDSYVLLDHYQEAYTTPGLNMTLRDLARFGQMVLQDGGINGQRIVPHEWVADIRAGGDPAAWLAGQSPEEQRVPLPGHAHGSYRDYWWMAERRCGRFAGIGLGGQLLVVDPTAHVVVVKFSSAPDINSGETTTLTAYYGIDAVISEVSGHSCHS